MRHDTTGASPLVVIITFVLVAVGITALVVFIALGGDEPDMELQTTEAPAIEVVQVQGDLRWEELEVRLLDRAGEDRSGFLDVPEGRVAEGDRITYRSPLPGGSYLLLVLHEGEELTRLQLQA